jgi:hypothetical protein
MAIPRPLLPVFGALSLVVLACTTILPDSSTRVVGSGNVVEETRSFEGIRGVSLDTQGDMHIVLGTKEELTIRVSESLQADLNSSGNLNNTGSPSVDATTHGSGDVIQIGK